MSAYLTYATPMTDTECLLEAIAEMGVPRAEIHHTEIPQMLRGWQTDQKANIVLRKETTGDRFNDIGFLRTTTGFTAIISNDHPQFGQVWLKEVGLRYSQKWADKQTRLAEAERQRIAEEKRILVEAQKMAIYEKAKKMGYSVKESKEGDTVRLVLVKRTY